MFFLGAIQNASCRGGICLQIHLPASVMFALLMCFSLRANYNYENADPRAHLGLLLWYSDMPRDSKAYTLLSEVIGRVKPQQILQVSIMIIR